jgi:hypothetical protein
VPTEYDVAIDFMDMTHDRRLWTRPEDVRPGLRLMVGAYVTVGDEGADPAVARVARIEPDGIIELVVLPGGVEAHRDKLTPGRAVEDERSETERAEQAAWIKRALVRFRDRLDWLRER